MNKQGLYSIRKVLLSWSAIALGLTAVVIGYFLYDALQKQFIQRWSTKIEHEMGILQQQLQYNLSVGDQLGADKNIALLGTQRDIRKARLIENGQIRLSTRRAEIGQALPSPDSQKTSHSNPSGSKPEEYGSAHPDGFSLVRSGSMFSASLPVRYYKAGLREQATANLLVEYDYRTEHHLMLVDMSQKLAVLLLLLCLYTLGLSQLVRRKVLVPLSRLHQLSTHLLVGDFGKTVATSSTLEFVELEASFNSLSRHLEDSQRQVKQANAVDRAFSRSFPDVAFLLDQTGVIIGRLGNPGSPVPSLNNVDTGARFDSWLPLQLRQSVQNQFDSAIKKNRLLVHTIASEHFSLESRMIQLDLPGQPSPAQNKTSVLWLLRDITEFRQQQQAIYDQAHFDFLTSLANRRFALEYLGKSIEQHTASDQRGAVLFIDLDHFKSINDSMGHAVGDSLLVQVADRLNDTVPGDTFCARLGGDEFLVVVEGTTADFSQAQEEAALLSKHLLRSLYRPYHCDSHNFHLSASIGITIFPDQGNSPEELVRQADTAMYFAKSNGRNRYDIYDEEMKTQSQQKLELLNDMHLALKAESFELRFQPQFNHLGKMVGAEALCRWSNRGRYLDPEYFIRAAEDSNLIVPLGNWVIQTSLDSLQRWKQSGVLPTEFKRLAINISPKQFLDTQFSSRLSQQLKIRGLKPQDIELEITESTFLYGTDSVINSLRDLSNTGFSIALDDFGTGYSSLSYLNILPINTLKIDRSFVLQIDSPGSNNLLVDYVVQLGKNLKIQVLAEGVENETQKRYLEEQGCSIYQGFYFSYPLSEPDFLTLAQRTTSLQ